MSLLTVGVPTFVHALFEYCYNPTALQKRKKKLYKKKIIKKATLANANSAQIVWYFSLIIVQTIPISNIFTMYVLLFFHNLNSFKTNLRFFLL